MSLFFGRRHLTAGCNSQSPFGSSVNRYWWYLFVPTANNIYSAWKCGKWILFNYLYLTVLIRAILHRGGILFRIYLGLYRNMPMYRNTAYPVSVASCIDVYSICKMYNDEEQRRICLFPLTWTRRQNPPPKLLAVFTHQDTDLSPNETSCNKGQACVSDPTKLGPPSSCLNLAM